MAAWFAIPDPLRRLFKHFPLVTYAPNELPFRSPTDRHLPTLHVFASERDALSGLPSYNPTCLKWQTFLKLSGLGFRTEASTNHASPTGALPFLLRPSSPADPDQLKPIPWNKLEQHVLDQGLRKPPEGRGMREDAYQILLDRQVRNAWLYALYLSPRNSTLLHRLYIDPVSSSSAVRMATLYRLRRAAEAQILESVGAPRANAASLYAGAERSFEALAAELGTDEWFGGSVGPGLFDAAVFAYTHLALDHNLEWVDTRLRDIVAGSPGLVAHRDRILARCWGDS